MLSMTCRAYASLGRALRRMGTGVAFDACSASTSGGFSTKVRCRSPVARGNESQRGAGVLESRCARRCRGVFGTKPAVRPRRNRRRSFRTRRERPNPPYRRRLRRHTDCTRWDGRCNCADEKDPSGRCSCATMSSRKLRRHDPERRARVRPRIEGLMCTSRRFDQRNTND